VGLEENAKKMGVYSCLITRMYGRSQHKNALIGPPKMWHITVTKISFMQKLREDKVQ
jgi:hypothetical protein